MRKNMTQDGLKRAAAWAVCIGLAAVLTGCPWLAPKSPGPSIQLSEVREYNGGASSTRTVQAGLRVTDDAGRAVALTPENTAATIEVVDAQGNVIETPEAHLLFVKRPNSRPVAVTVDVLTANGTPYANVAVTVYRDRGVDAEELAMSDVLARGLTDAEGRFTGVVQAPSGTTALFVVASALGIDNKASVAIVGDTAEHVFN